MMRRWVFFCLLFVCFGSQAGAAPLPPQQQALLDSSCPAAEAASYQKTPVQKLVNDANRLADTQDFLAALCRYQVVVARQPHQPTLLNNWGVLVFNHAMTLQQQHRYEESRQWLGLAQQLQPSHAEPKDAVAASYFDEAMWLRNQPNTEATDALVVHRLLQAKALNPNLPNLKRALGMTYLQQGVERSHAGDWPESVELLSKARIELPDHPDVPQVLAQTKLQWAQTLDATDPQRKMLLEEAQALDVDLAPSVKQLLAGKRIANATLGSASDNQSLPQKMAAVETILGLSPDASATLPQRLAAAERTTFGKPKDGPLDVRIHRLHQSLLGVGNTMANSPTQLASPIQTVDGTYLDAILTTTEGRVIRWSRFPLSVAVDWPSDWLKDDQKQWPESIPTKEALQHAIRNGIQRWVGGTQGFVSVVWTSRPSEADVRIVFEDTYTDRFAQADMKVLHNFTVPKASNLAKALGLASMFTPGVASLGPQAGAALLQYQQVKKLDTVQNESRLVLGKNRLNANTPAQLENTVAYEFGQILGLKGLSEDAADIRHPSTIEQLTPKPLSERDIATLRALYQRPASIILNLN
ncbi:MAG: hypothetical protein QE263_01715 [Vampirovibrionales bacterium]|nr:hypothetical protein [Vampirovibrionales bacterium]